MAWHYKQYARDQASDERGAYAHLTIKDLMEPFPMEWERQQEHFFSRGSAVQGTCTGVWRPANVRPGRAQICAPYFNERQSVILLILAD